MTDDLFAKIRDAQDEALENDAALRDAVEERVMAHARAPRPRARSWAPRLAVAAAIGLAIGGASAWALTRGPAPRPPITFEAHGGVASVGGFVEALEGAELRFSDRSVVRALPGSSARVVATTADGADVIVERGAVEAAIVHDATTDWRFLAGPFAIVVTGTRFDARWSPEAAELALSVHEGSVRVEGACLERPRAVRGGESLRARCERWRTEETRAAHALAPADVRAELAAPAPHRAITRVPPERAASETDAPAPAERALTPRAIAPPQPEPPSAPTALAPAEPEPPTVLAPTAPAHPEPSTAAAQIETAMRAALAGDADGAERTLREARAAHPGTSDASLAAFLLGRLAFDEQHDYEEAARWFATYVAERPSGPLAREAMGRELEARIRSGDAAAARAAAERYLARFPDGPHAARARAIVASR